MADTRDLRVPMDSHNPGFWVDGGLTIVQRSTIRRLIGELQAGELTISELLDAVEAVRGMGADQGSLPLEF